jgi:hypothetical protein
MSIPFQHLQSLVARNGRHLHRVQAFFKEAACGFVAEIVKGEILEGQGNSRSLRLYGIQKEWSLLRVGWEKSNVGKDGRPGRRV